MLFRKKPKITKQEALAVRPIRLVEGEIVDKDDGGANVKVPLRQRRWAAWFFKVPPGATKTFELDALGRLVWENCDGKTSVQQIIRKLAKRYNLGLREAEVPTVKFLQMLVKKGLVGMQAKEKKE
jgi:hypothetical protein